MCVYYIYTHTHMRFKFINKPHNRYPNIFETSMIMATKNNHCYHEEPLADQNPNPNPNHTSTQDNLDDDEPDDAVSLCDLPIYGSTHSYETSDSEDSMKEDQSFEFFSEGSLKEAKDSKFFPQESIVFCGNLILPKPPVSGNTQEFKKRDHGSTKVDRSPGSIDGRKSEVSKLRRPVNRRASPASASRKSRWYYYGVGLAGVPTEMDLGAIRSRQNQSRKNHLVRPPGGSEKEESGGFLRRKWLGRLIRDLSCGGQNSANSMVKASLVCIPRV